MQMTISARQLRPGQIVIFEDGKQLRVVSAEFGDCYIGGDQRTARAIDVKFDGGLVLQVHPASPVSVNGGFFDAVRSAFSRKPVRIIARA